MIPTFEIIHMLQCGRSSVKKARASYDILPKNMWQRSDEIMREVAIYTVSNRNAGRTVKTPELRSYNAEFRSFSTDSPPFLVF